LEKIYTVLHEVQYAKQQRTTANKFERSVWLQNCWQLPYWI